MLASEKPSRAYWRELLDVSRGTSATTTYVSGVTVMVLGQTTWVLMTGFLSNDPEQVT